MSGVDWFTNEREFTSEFINETAALLKEVQEADKAFSATKENDTAKQESAEKEDIKNEGSYQDTDKESKSEIIDKIQQLQAIKEAYMGEELMDTLETLSLSDEGEELAEKAYEVMTAINLLMRKYHVMI